MFFNINFIINENVMIPRHATETLIEVCIRNVPKKEDITILDLGTGSGCILITLIKTIEKSKGVGIDICPKALKVAENNVFINKLHERISLRIGEFNNITTNNLDLFDIIVSNPPYLTKKTSKSFLIENNEPDLALFSNDNSGLKCYFEIRDGLVNILNVCSNSAILVIEIAHGMAEKVKRVFIGIDKHDIKVENCKHFGFLGMYKDLHGLERCLMFKINK